MPQISLQKPTDQPSGRNRLLDELRHNLTQNDLNQFRIMVAFAKSGPLLRLKPEIEHWTQTGKTIEAVFGIDAKGTSRQALEFALTHFQQTFIAHVAGTFNPTFHPKIYLFTSETRAVAYVGSNNLTVGGTETNLESHLKLSLTLPEDAELLAELQEAWQDAQQVSLELTAELLTELSESGLIPTEKEMRRTKRTTPTQPQDPPHKSQPTFPTLKVIPPSAIPKKALVKPKKKKGATPVTDVTPALPTDLTVQALVIQIVPHHNGEVFLSKTAIDQNPQFFGWPFTGQTSPKKPTNPAYPQREPDPIINLTLFDQTGQVIVSHPKFNLNTVYYAPKSEIRITVPPDVVQATPDYSIMVMRQADEEMVDYEVEIYAPGSDLYQIYLAVCNQTMPSGGKAVGRRFGWL